MSQEDVTLDGAGNGVGAARLRRPALERSEPRRGWVNLYAPGRADAEGRAPAPDANAANAPPPAEPRTTSANDAAARVVRDGYRIVEENLRRGRQVAAELRGVGREVADFTGRVDAPRVVSNLTQTLIDPALTEQLVGVARSFLSALGAAMPSAPSTAAPAPVASEPAAAARIPLHPQARPDYPAVGARVLKLRSVGPGEWLADLEIDGEVRRVQVRAVDGEL